MSSIGWTVVCCAHTLASHAPNGRRVEGPRSGGLSTHPGGAPLRLAAGWEVGRSEEREAGGGGGGRMGGDDIATWASYGPLGARRVGPPGPAKIRFRAASGSPLPFVWFRLQLKPFRLSPFRLSLSHHVLCDRRVKV